MFLKKCQVFGNFWTFKWQFSGGSGSIYNSFIPLCYRFRHIFHFVFDPCVQFHNMSEHEFCLLQRCQIYAQITARLAPNRNIFDFLRSVFSTLWLPGLKWVENLFYKCKYLSDLVPIWRN